MEIKLHHLPIIDWKLSMKLAGNKQEIAEEILHQFIKSLPSSLATLKQLHKNNLTYNYSCK